MEILVLPWHHESENRTYETIYFINLNNDEVCDTSLWNDFIVGDKPSIFSYRRNENKLCLYPDTIDCIETAINISKEIANDISTIYVEIDNIAIEYNDKLVE